MERIRVGTVTITQQDIDAVTKTLQSGFVGPGLLTKKFEQLISEAHGFKYGLALNSGQSALMVLAEALRKTHNTKRIAVPAVTYISSLSAMLQAGLQPVLADVTPDCEAQMMYDTIDNNKVDAFLPCHLFGRCNDRDDKETNRRHGKFIIEDNCESIYAPGTGFGDAMCVSFFSSHAITAGFGGMILLNDEDLYFKCWQLVNHGRQDWDNYASCAELKYKHVFSEVGYSLKFADINAALGISQHEQAQVFIDQKRKNAKYLIDGLKDIDELILPKYDNHTFMLFPIVCKTDRRENLLAALHKVEIETRMMMPITNQPMVREWFGPKIEDQFPNAKFINNHGFVLGCHQNLTQDDLDRIIETINVYYQ